MIDDDADAWSLLGNPRRIDQIQVDFRFGLMLDDGTLVIIESPFTATIDGRAVAVAPETLEGVGAVMAVLHRTVTAVRAMRSGALRVELSDGGLIEVAPGDAYENWQVLMPDGSQLVGLPAGDVAAFPPRPGA
ncbi:MAG: DUF6188 family protein [Ilumatobacteraceae bacterium]